MSGSKSENAKLKSAELSALLHDHPLRDLMIFAAVLDGNWDGMWSKERFETYADLYFKQLQRQSRLITPRTTRGKFLVPSTPISQQGTLKDFLERPTKKRKLTKKPTRRSLFVDDEADEITTRALSEAGSDDESGGTNEYVEDDFCVKG